MFGICPNLFISLISQTVLLFTEVAKGPTFKVAKEIKLRYLKNLLNYNNNVFVLSYFAPLIISPHVCKVSIRRTFIRKASFTLRNEERLQVRVRWELVQHRCLVTWPTSVYSGSFLQVTHWSVLHVVQLDLITFIS